MEGIRIAMGLYGALMLIGGIMGYATAQSVPSLIAGIVSGILIAVAFVVSRTQPKAGFGLGAVVAVVLAIEFFRRFQVTGKVMPSAMLCAVSVLAALIIGSGMRFSTP